MLKYNPMHWLVLSRAIKGALRKRFSPQEVKEMSKNAKKEYVNLLNKAEEIGKGNPMAYNLYSCLLILSFYQGNKDKLEEEDLSFMINEMFREGFLHKFISKTDYNRKKDVEKFRKRMERSYSWIEKNKEKYPKIWEFEFDENKKDGVAYSFSKCPIADYFNKHELSHLTHYFCEIDYLMVEKAKGTLVREHTIAAGDGECDFWIYGNKIKNPN